MALLAELKRRRVFRVAGVYAATAWVMAEATSVVIPALLLPERIVTVVVVLLILGFPFALILAWIFDIQPGGVERTVSAPEVAARLQSRGARLAYAVLLVVTTVALAGLAYWRFSGTPAARDSIAVLPFANLSGDPAREFFSDGISEELLNLLAKVPGLKVAARTSSFAMKGEDLDIREVGERLGVATVLEGSVRWSTEGDRVRITAQLIDVANGFHLWSETYDRELKDIFVVQDDIAQSIVERLKGQLDAPDGMMVSAAPPTSDVEAYTYYLQGRALWQQRGVEEIKRSIELFQKAVARDPGFARAHSNLAAAYVLLPSYANEPRDQSLPLASEAALKALTIDANLAEAHAVLANISQTNWAWTDAENGFFFATSLDADDPTARHWYSVLLRRSGRLRESLVQAELAMELDPESPVIVGNLAICLALNGRGPESVAAVRQATELGLVGGREVELWLLTRQGGFSEARARLETEEMEPEAGGAWRDVITFMETKQVADIPPEALDDAEPMGRLFASVVIGDLDAAYAAAEELLTARQLLPDELWWPYVRDFRLDPRFSSLMARVGLVDYWRRFGWPDGCGPGEQGGVRCN